MLIGPDGESEGDVLARGCGSKGTFGAIWALQEVRLIVGIRLHRMMITINIMWLQLEPESLDCFTYHFLLYKPNGILVLSLLRLYL